MLPAFRPTWRVWFRMNGTTMAKMNSMSVTAIIISTSENPDRGVRAAGRAIDARAIELDGLVMDRTGLEGGDGRRLHDRRAERRGCGPVRQARHRDGDGHCLVVGGGVQRPRDQRHARAPGAVRERALGRVEGRLEARVRRVRLDLLDAAHGEI